MTLPLKLRARKGTGATTCGSEPQSGFLFTSQLCLFFFIHISCVILAWKGLISFTVEGQVSVGSQVARRTTRWGGGGGAGAAFLDSKHQNSSHKQRKYFPRERAAQSCVVIQNMYLYINVISGHPQEILTKKIMTFEWLYWCIFMYFWNHYLI